MRILMFGWEFPPFNSGGLGVACLGLTRAMRAQGADVIFVMPKKLDVSSPYATFRFADQFQAADGLKIRAFDSILSPYLTSQSYAFERSKAGDFYGDDLMSEVLRYASKGASIARSEAFDVVYAHDWLSFGPAMEAKRVSGKPMVAHVHATEIDRCGGRDSVNPQVFAIEKAGLEAADQIIAVSELTKSQIVRHYGIPASKVQVVYNGIDETTAPRGASEIKKLRNLKAAGYKIVLFLGRVTLQKGPDYFIRAAQLVSKADPKALFIIAGAGDMDRSIMSLAAELGIADKILFAGFVQGAARYDLYAAADLFVMPSVSEPFGITPLEAMRQGTPVLISKQSGVSEVVNHALKADFWDVEELANKISAVLRYPGLRDTLSHHAYYESEGLTWERAASEVDNVIRRQIASAV